MVSRYGFVRGARQVIERCAEQDLRAGQLLEVAERYQPVGQQRMALDLAHEFAQLVLLAQPHEHRRGQLAKTIETGAGLQRCVQRAFVVGQRHHHHVGALPRDSCVSMPSQASASSIAKVQGQKVKSARL